MVYLHNLAFNIARGSGEYGGCGALAQSCFTELVGLVTMDGVVHLYNLMFHLASGSGEYGGCGALAQSCILQS